MIFAKFVLFVDSLGGVGGTLGHKINQKSWERPYEMKYVKKFRCMLRCINGDTLSSSETSDNNKEVYDAPWVFGIECWNRETRDELRKHHEDTGNRDAILRLEELSDKEVHHGWLWHLSKHHGPVLSNE